LSGLELLGRIGGNTYPPRPGDGDGLRRQDQPPANLELEPATFSQTSRFCRSQAEIAATCKTTTAPMKTKIPGS
jgi:hypothetical protein